MVKRLNFEKYCRKGPSTPQVDFSHQHSHILTQWSILCSEEYSFSCHLLYGVHGAWEMAWESWGREREWGNGGGSFGQTSLCGASTTPIMTSPLQWRVHRVGSLCGRLWDQNTQTSRRHWNTINSGCGEAELRKCTCSCRELTNPLRAQVISDLNLVILAATPDVTSGALAEARAWPQLTRLPRTLQPSFSCTRHRVGPLFFVCFIYCFFFPDYRKKIFNHKKYFFLKT